MHLHCPRCGKLYFVPEKDGLLQSESHFICPTCENEFVADRNQSDGQWIVRSSLDLDFIEDEQGVAPKVVDALICPGCSKEVKSYLEECRHCGKVPQKIFDSMRRQSSPTELPDPIEKRVKAVWQELLDQFHDLESHQHFIQVCEKLNQLEFAENRYRSVQSIMGDDPLVLKCLEAVKTLQFDRVSESQPSKEIHFWRTHQLAILMGIIGSALILIGAGLSLKFVLFIGIFIISWILLDGFKK